MQAFMNALSPGYFETMHVPILEGRDFELKDVTENSKVAIVNRRFAEHFFQGKSAVGKHLGRGGGPDDEAGHRDHRRRRRLAVRGTARRRAAPGLRAELGPGTARCSTCGRTPARARLTALIRNEVKQLDSAMPVYAMKTLEGQLDETLLTDRLIALAVGRLRPARHVTRVDRTLRRDGVRRRAAQEGAGDPPGARRAARAGDLAA